MRSRLLIFILILAPLTMRGQQFNYSLLDFTHHRINPATIGLNNQWYASVVHREQNRGADFKIRSTAFSGAYPQLFPRRGNVRGALGIDLMNDISGLNNSFRVREAGLSYALRIVDEELQSFNLGVSLFYQNRGFDYSQITTNSQYVTNRGFDLSLASGENLIDFNQSFYRLNAGIFWQKLTLKKQKAGHFGISAFDINEARDTFYDNQSTFNPTYFLTAGLLAYGDRKIHVYPAILLVQQSGRMLYNASVETTYTMDREQSVSFKPRYLVNRELIAVFEYQKGNMVFGVSYDIPVNGSNAANFGAFEFGMKIMGDVRPKQKRRKRSGRPSAPAQTKTARKEIPEWPIKPYVPYSPPPAILKFEPNPPQLKEPLAMAEVEFDYTFYYATDRATFDPQVANELKEIISSLGKSAEYVIYIEGHTDSSGSEEYNLTLSLQRARAIADFLQREGLDESRIKVEGFGEELPVANNDDRIGRALNRRVELRLIRH
ncbi:PorP/SprF family type IX secretion system membrane protein [Roseivirga sp.]|uniref:PorP/SprF family type IX secretion system membrane protein n=1 Tax=Roseivirga sp. TaxID=1964215 RepID=UPI003B529227